MFQFFIKFSQSFRQPDFDFNVNMSRLVCCVFISYKLLSRDFGFYGTVPPEFFTFYPYKVYSFSTYRLWTGLPILTELATFHWIHWFVPRPGVLTLRIVQAVTLGLMLTTGLYGRGPSRIWAIGAFIGVLYLWGHLILGAHEIDSVAIYFGLLLAFTFLKFDDRPVWQFRKLFRKPSNTQAGIAYSSLIFVFCVYYFSSGYNKVTDILVTDIFDSNLNIAIQKFYITDIKGYINIPDILYEFSKFEFSIIDYLGPIFVYLSHLMIPMILFNRNWIWKFAVFYTLFHFIVFGVGISFLGYIFVWFAILPYRRAAQKKAPSRFAKVK